jgi:hypothetical protein
VRLEGELKGEERRGKRGRASGRSAKRANGLQPLARNAISCRYFGSGLGGGLAWKGAAKPKNNGIHPSGMRDAHLPSFHEAPKGFVV